MYQEQQIKIEPVAQSLTIAAGGMEYSSEIEMKSRRPAGYFATMLTISGSGSLTIDYEVTDDVNGWVTPDDATSVASNLTAGTYFFRVDVPVCARFRFKYTESGGTDSVTIDNATILIQ